MHIFHGTITPEYLKPNMKNSNVKFNVVEKSCIHKIMTDLNTQYNGYKSESDKSMIQIIRNLVLLHGENFDQCDGCDETFIGRSYKKKHIRNSCNTGGNNVNKIQKSKEHNHGKYNECELCENVLKENQKFKEHSQSFHDDCQQCGDNFVDESDLSNHLGSAHEEETVPTFMVHHEEENDGGEFEMNPAI